jgi:hypothetical protein
MGVIDDVVMDCCDEVIGWIIEELGRNSQQ